MILGSGASFDNTFLKLFTIGNQILPFLLVATSIWQARMWTLLVVLLLNSVHFHKRLWSHIWGWLSCYLPAPDYGSFPECRLQRSSPGLVTLCFLVHQDEGRARAPYPVHTPTPVVTAFLQNWTGWGKGDDSGYAGCKECKCKEPHPQDLHMVLGAEEQE